MTRIAMLEGADALTTLTILQQNCRRSFALDGSRDVMRLSVRSRHNGCYSGQLFCVEFYLHATPDSTVATVRIVIADQSPIFRDGLRRVLEADARLIAVADTHLDSLVPTLQATPDVDVLLLGAASSGNFWADSLHAIATAGIAIRTILLAASIDLPQVTAALRAGASGVVAKDSAAELLFKSIDAVMAGQCWVGGEAASRSVEASVRRLDHARRHEKGFGLTRRELDIIRAVLDGDTNREIAKRLSISENTVKRHLMHTYNKMGVSSRVELALFAAHHRLLDGI